MEHIPLADGAQRPQLRIPFVVKSASDFPYHHREDDFISFPEHHLRELRFIHVELDPKEALLSLAQAWLYFGTLTEFFQLPINADTLTTYDQAGGRFISTSALDELRSRWMESLPLRSPISTSFRRTVARRCGRVLCQAIWALNQLQNMFPEDPAQRLVMFSIKLMMCSLCHTARAVLLSTPTLDALLNQLAFLPAAADDGTGTDFLLWDYMVGNGWCPYQINHLLTLHNATSMVYLSSISRTKRNIGHRDCLRSGSCKSSQVDWNAFSSLHTTPGCGCGQISVNEQQIMDKLEQKQVPLLSCTKNALDEFSIEVIQAKTDRVFGSTFYYAVSHVRLFHYGGLPFKTTSGLKLPSYTPVTSTLNVLLRRSFSCSYFMSLKRLHKFLGTL
jgi:hypothetical protein